ncbi:MAG: aminoacyl-tRNA hydrolase [Alphaproteobacteria bacterium]|jgi:PTH1 family peptidyl-tRNA hydrolase|nr:aminoacyl-tRNA hydrolase [Alphaproteobacteria bacterium]
MFLLVGLGNPGSEHASNRHNIGFMAVDEIVRRHDFSPWRKRFQGVTAEGHIGPHHVLALKPMTYMNLSGQSAGEAARFLKIPLEKIIVLHDELDLAPGKIRVKTGGGAGGHNGLKSLDAHLGNGYKRLRLGIGHPGDKDAVTGYVLSGFAKSDKEWLEPFLDVVGREIGLALAGEDNRFMTKVAMALKPATDKKEDA